MFKSILPSRRVPSTEFQMVTAPGPTDIAVNDKENQPTLSVGVEASPKKKKAKSKDQQNEANVAPGNFDQLLDELQIPTSLRPKLETMDAKVKAQFLKSSKVILSKPTSTAAPMTPKGLRKAHSSESLSPTKPPTKRNFEDVDLGQPLEPPKRPNHLRGVSFHLYRQAAAQLSKEPIEPLNAKLGPKDKRAKTAAISPVKYCNILKSNSSTSLDVETAKKLRLLLRNEPASWTEEFLSHGGYDALLTRLNEILQVEWREEQHDDQILHELLRCVKALSTSSIGCAALRSCCPTPYAQLVTLLYSDKKPGEVGTRLLIVELLQLLFDLYPASSLPASGLPSASVFSVARTRASPSTSNLVVLPEGHATLFSFIRSLLLTPAPPSAEADGPGVEPHAFIEELHKPRIYKTYLQEISDICRDYFWVFCHPNNSVWILHETDEAKVEKPRAPGGMTGGVEFEAMQYMTAHMKLVNSVASLAQETNLPKDHELSAYQFHNDMFLSGIERILLLARKASTTYYPTLHLEIARYVAAAGRAGYDLPWDLSRLMGPPPSGMRKQVAPPRSPTRSKGTSSTSVPATPTRRSAVPGAPKLDLPNFLPGSRKVTPMFGL